MFDKSLRTLMENQSGFTAALLIVSDTCKKSAITHSTAQTMPGLSHLTLAMYCAMSTTQVKSSNVFESTQTISNIMSCFCVGDHENSGNRSTSVFHSN